MSRSARPHSHLERSLVLAMSPLFLVSGAIAAPKAAPATVRQEIVIDSVVASVNEKPITLSDVLHRISPPRTVTLAEAANDPQVRQTLDMLIFEQLILIDAEAKHVSVTDEEVNRYLDEVAARNNLSRSAFEAALVSEGRKLDEYKTQVKVEILKSKLAGSYVRGGVSVTQDEVDEYLSQTPSLSGEGTKVKLRQILISTAGRSPDAAQAKAEEAKRRIDGGEAFAKVASELSDSPEARDGGDLGVVAEKDLSPELLAVVEKLSAGQHSDIVKTDAGLHLFQLDERLDGGNESKDAKEKLREEARKVLQQRKMDEKMQTYFSSELYKQYAVDKKI